MEKDDVIEIDLMRLFRALWHRAWVLILAMLLFGSAAFGYAQFLITPLYQSSALMYVNNSTISVGSTSVSLSDLTASQSLVETYIVILKTRLTMNEVIKQANLPYTYEELCEMVSADSVNGTEIFRIEVTSPDPKEAETIANTIVEVLPDKIGEIMDGSSVRTVDFAVVPTEKASPSIVRYTLIGVLLGFLVCAGIVVLLEMLDEQIHNEEYLVQTYQLPVLAAVPDLLSSSGKKGYGDGYGYYRKTEEPKQ